MGGVMTETASGGLSAFTTRLKQNTVKATVVDEAVVEERASNDSLGYSERVVEAIKRFPDEVSILPTELTRTALFPLRLKKQERRLLNKTKLASRQDVTLEYTGIELDQDDADIWLACIRLANGHGLGERVYTSASALLRESGRKGRGGDNIKLLLESLDRLSSADIKVTYKRNEQVQDAHLFLLKSGVNHATKEIYFRLDPEAAELFRNVAYIGWDARCKLKSRKAKAIHSYICGHKAGKRHTVKLTDLMSWLGHKGRKADFLKNLDKACDEIVNVNEITDLDINKKADRISWVRRDNA